MDKKVALLIGLLTIQNLFPQEALTNSTKSVLHDAHLSGSTKLSSNEIVNKNKQFLRSKISASDQEIVTACEMYEQGWTYTMPQPKSSKAAWGITDSRTTWYNGWWYNSKTGLYSISTPKKSSNGLYLGDNKIMPIHGKMEELQANQISICFYSPKVEVLDDKMYSLA